MNESKQQETDTEIISNFIEQRKEYLNYYSGLNLKRTVSAYLHFYLSVLKHDVHGNLSANYEICEFLLEKFGLSKNVPSWNLKYTHSINPINKHPWYRLLKEHQEQIVFYIFNEDQLHALTPLIKSITHPILLLTEFGVSEDTNLPDNISALEFDFSLKITYRNDFVETNFPILYHYLNSFEQLVQLLLPKGVIFMDGYLFQQEALFVVAKRYNIKTICIQEDKSKYIKFYYDCNYCDYNYILCGNSLRKEGENNIYPLSSIQNIF